MMNLGLVLRSKRISTPLQKKWKTIFLLLLYYYNIIIIQARFAAGGHFVSAGGSLRSPGVTLVNYKGDNISKYVCPTVLIDITRKITKFVNLKIFDAK